MIAIAILVAALRTRRVPGGCAGFTRIMEVDQLNGLDERDARKCHQPPKGCAVSWRTIVARAALLALIATIVALSFQALLPSLILPTLLQPRGTVASKSKGSDGPCDGGFAPYEPKWRGPDFVHAVDMISAYEMEERGVPPNITATALFAGATSEGDKAAFFRPVYFVLDFHIESAYAHWQIECAVFLREWAYIQSAHPDARIVIGSERSYKRVVMALYGISHERIVLLADVPRKNYCIFAPFNMINNAAADPASMITWWDAHVRYMQCAAGLNVRGSIYNRISRHTPLDNELGPIIPISVLVMPRGTKENLRQNDRTYSGYDELSQWAEANNGRAFHTDNVTDFRVQIRAIAAARIVVLPEGSAYTASGSFAAHSLVIVVGTYLTALQSLNPRIVALYNYVAHGCMHSCNDVLVVQSAADVLPAIMGRFAHEMR